MAKVKKPEQSTIGQSTPLPPPDAPQSMMGQSYISPFTGKATSPGFNAPTSLAPTPNLPPQINPNAQNAQILAGQDFIQRREKSISKLMEAGYSRPAAENLANASAQEQTAGLSYQQVSAGARSQAEIQAGSEVAGLGGTASTEPSLQSQSNEAGIAVLSVAASLAATFAGRGSAITSSTKLLKGGALIGTAGTIERQRVADAKNLFTNSKQHISDTVSAMKAGMIDWETGMKLINEQMNNINAQERFLKSINSNVLSQYLSGGKDDLVDIQGWRQEFNDITSRELVTIRLSQLGS